MGFSRVLLHLQKRAVPRAEQPVKDDSSWKARRLLGEADRCFKQVMAVSF